MKIAYIFILIAVFAASCEFNKSTSIDFSTGITTKGDGLSCDNVSLSSGDERINRNEFIYEEKITISLTNIKGFTKKNNNVYPGMSLLVLDKRGDTMLYNADLYADYNDGFDIDPITLIASIKVGDPIRSNKSYTLFLHTWDKKGKGTFDTELQFSVVPNPALKLESAHASFDEIFLFDTEKKAGITSTKIKQYQETLLVYNGLKGFKQQDGKCQIGLSMHATDANGKIILEEADLLKDQELEFAVFSKQFISTFNLGNQKVVNPIRLEVFLWDKLGNARIRANIDLDVE